MYGYHHGARLASKRELSLLANFLNEKYGHAVKGNVIEHNLAKWSHQELEKSLRAA